MFGRTKRAKTPAQVEGKALVDRRTKDMIRRLEPGDIAVIDHADLDRVAADGLIEAGVVAVVNAAASISGRYPNGGPIRVVRAGIPLLDNAGKDLLDRVREGDTLRIIDGEIWRGDELLATAKVLTESDIEAAMEDARAAIGVELEHFADNTLEYIRREARLTFEPLTLPPLHTKFVGRHALVVVRGHDYRSDLAALRPYIREYHPVLIGVDGGADALHEMGYKPHMIVGDMDSVGDEVLNCGAEVVVHAYPDGRAPGLTRVQDLGIDAVTFPALGTSEDIAMLLADEKGASLIVAVGTHATLVEFLDKGRGGMASTFLTRLRLGGKLVDAKGVTRLYRSRISAAALLILVLAAFAAIGAALVVSDAGRTYLDLFADKWDKFLDWVQGLFS